MIKLIYVGDKYVLLCPFEHRALAKDNGFKWDGSLKRWWTTEPDKALRMEQYADADCRARLASLRSKLQKAVADSRAATSDFDVAGLKLPLMPFQRAGAAYGVTHRRIIIADQPGLGKSCQALAIMHHLGCYPLLVVCPASLKINWQREACKFLPIESGEIAQLSGRTPEPLFAQLGKITIINYDVLSSWVEVLSGMGFRGVVFDESHLCKNGKTARAKAAKAIAKVIDMRLLLTGTPLTNRPSDLCAQLEILGRIDEFGGPWKFLQRYTNPVRNGFGWDFTGASHLEELQKKLRAGIMIRRLKSEVLPELPDKTRQVIELPADEFHALLSAEAEAWERAQSQSGIDELKSAVELAKACASDDEYHAAVHALRDGITAAFAEVAKLRKQTAMAKLPMVIEHIRMAIDSGKVVVACHHHDIIDRIISEFGDKCVKLDGRDSLPERQRSIDSFQQSDHIQIFVGQMQAAGVGITLTASSHVIFAEEDWVPSNLTQYEDRCHRIGAKSNVLVQHLVLEGSLDARMAKVNVQKQAVIDRVLDKESMVAIADTPVTPEPEAATHGTSRKRILIDADKIDDALRESIHQCLKMLAGTDTDFAAIRNDVGFSKFDVKIGHSLAEAKRLSPAQAALGARLVVKYGRQLPAEIVEQCRELIRIKKEETNDDSAD